MKNIVIIGSSGSIGTQALNVISRHSDKYRVLALVAGSNAELLLKQKEEFGVLNYGLFSYNEKCDDGVCVFKEKCYDFACMEQADVVLIASSGVSALPYVVKAIKAKKVIAIANKETLVAAGEIIMPMVKEYGATLIPVDSEHSAIWQSKMAGQDKDVRRILLTCSGGPFRDTPIEKLATVTLSDTLKHPNWSMGRKITCDSATMFNKALEVIEAKWLFDVDDKDIEVVVHKESIVHSMVEFNDSTVMAELSYPSMEIPIQLAFSYPDRFESGVKGLDFKTLSTLSFEPLDEVKFKAVALARKMLSLGGFHSAIMNSANEEIVNRFINGEIRYVDVYPLVEKVANMSFPKMDFTIENILVMDEKVREVARTVSL